jgi:hypothetical protein
MKDEKPFHRTIPANGADKLRVNAPRSAFDLVPPRAKAPRKWTAWNPDAFTIRKGVPIPPSRNKRSAGAFDLLNRMNTGDSIVVSPSQMKTLRAVATNHKIKITVRKFDDHTYGVWKC